MNRSDYISGWIKPPMREHPFGYHEGDQFMARNEMNGMTQGRVYTLIYRHDKWLINSEVEDYARTLGNHGKEDFEKYLEKV